MSILQRLLLTIILLIAVPACAASGAGGTATVASAPLPAPTTGISPTEENQPEENDLANTEWRLTSFGPIEAETPVLEGTAVTLTFDAAGQAGGSGGCNSYGSDYQVQGNTLIFGEVVSTLMACTDEGITEQEQRFHGALRSAESFSQTADRLTILYNDRQNVLNFIPAAAVDNGSSSSEVFPPENPTRITFASGETSAEIGPTSIAEYDIDYYVLGALEGQDCDLHVAASIALRRCLYHWPLDHPVGRRRHLPYLAPYPSTPHCVESGGPRAAQGVYGLIYRQAK